MSEEFKFITGEINFPKNKWNLIIGSGVYKLIIPFPDAPNWFWRKMQYLILGFKWEKLSSDEPNRK